MYFNIIARSSNGRTSLSESDNLGSIPSLAAVSVNSVHVRHIYLSNDGHIESIEFEPFAWFVLNYYMNMVREYIPNVPKSFILNTKKFEHFDYQKMIEELLDNDLKETYSFNAFATPYAKEKLLKKIFDDFEKLLTQEKIDYLIKLNSPTK